MEVRCFLTVYLIQRYLTFVKTHLNVYSNGCYLLHVHYSVSCSVVSDSLWPHELQPARLLCPWDLPGKNTGVGCHSLLQGIFLTQGLNPFEPSNPGLPHCRQILYHLRHQGNHVVCICTLDLYKIDGKNMLSKRSWYKRSTYHLFI